MRDPDGHGHPGFIPLHKKMSENDEQVWEGITLYTDGACRGNQKEGGGVGGWGVLMVWKGRERELWGGEKPSTNNRMELTAVIEGLKALKRRDLPVKIVTDSAYVVNCFRERWYERWQKNGWLNSRKEPVENQDLWQGLLLELTRLATYDFVKVKGHAGHPGNERADALANRGADDQQNGKG